jgi:hypothetical protein
MVWGWGAQQKQSLRQAAFVPDKGSAWYAAGTGPGSGWLDGRVSAMLQGGLQQEGEPGSFLGNNL